MEEFSPFIRSVGLEATGRQVVRRGALGGRGRGLVLPCVALRRGPRAAACTLVSQQGPRPSGLGPSYVRAFSSYYANQNVITKGRRSFLFYITSSMQC